MPLLLLCAEREGNMPYDLYNTMIACKSEDPTERNDALEELYLRTANTREHYIHKLNGIFGAEELKAAFVTENDADMKSKEIIRAMVKKWDPEKCAHGSKAIGKYVGKYLDGEMKGFICEVNDIPSHYVDHLVSIKNAGLDLWETDDDILMAHLATRKGAKQTRRLLLKLRNIFENPKADEYGNVKGAVFTNKELMDYMELQCGLTSYYFGWYLAIKNAGYDLFETDIRTLEKFVRKTDPNRKDPRVLIHHMRDRIDRSTVENTIDRVMALGYAGTPRVNLATAPKVTPLAPIIETKLPDKVYGKYTMSRVAMLLRKHAGVSQHYAKWFAIFDSYGANVVHDKDNVLCSIVKKENESIKRPAHLINKLRDICAENSNIANVLAIAHAEGGVI